MDDQTSSSYAASTPEGEENMDTSSDATSLLRSNSKMLDSAKDSSDAMEVFEDAVADAADLSDEIAEAYSECEFKEMAEEDVTAAATRSVSTQTASDDDNDANEISTQSEYQDAAEELSRERAQTDPLAIHTEGSGHEGVGGVLGFPSSSAFNRQERRRMSLPLLNIHRSAAPAEIGEQGRAESASTLTGGILREIADETFGSSGPEKKKPKYRPYYEESCKHQWMRSGDQHGL